MCRERVGKQATEASKPTDSQKALVLTGDANEMLVSDVHRKTEIGQSTYLDIMGCRLRYVRLK